MRLLASPIECTDILARRTSMSVEVDPQTVLASMQNSIWGGRYIFILILSLTYHVWIIDLMLEAAEEEQM